ncbi:MAG: flavodoxin family protein [Desulfobacterota bacterium]|nr:flavodoxin family protein [Thermodesulfobacteriota bacterium]
MKILGILGSPRRKGNSDLLLDQALAGAKEMGAKVEKIALSRKKIAGCLDCTKCNKTGLCVIQDDMLEIHQKILKADGLIHSVPLYFWAMTSQMKAYLDRWCAFFDENWNWHKAYEPKMKGKRIGLITVCGDPDPHTADPIVHSFRETCKFSGLHLFPVVQVSAAVKGEVAKNEKAKREAFLLGQKIATPS